MFDLTQKLQKYQPFDAVEAEKLAKIKEFLAKSENCFDRSNLAGHVTAGALVCDFCGNVLLNHHKRANMWFQFGGHSDGDTNSLAVARREVFEETGIKNITLATDDVFDVDVHEIEYNAKKNEPAHLHYDINFLFLVNDHDFCVSNESIEIKWVTVDEARNLICSDDQGMRRMLTKYENYLKNTNK